MFGVARLPLLAFVVCQSASAVSVHSTSQNTELFTFVLLFCCVLSRLASERLAHHVAHANRTYNCMWHCLREVWVFGMAHTTSRTRALCTLFLVTVALIACGAVAVAQFAVKADPTAHATQITASGQIGSTHSAARSSPSASTENVHGDGLNFTPHRVSPLVELQQLSQDTSAVFRKFVAVSVVPEPRPVSVAEALGWMQLQWEGNASHPSYATAREFVSLLSTTVAGAPESAVFWEMPPISAHTIHQRQFEFVLKAAPTLASQPPQPAPFSAQLARHCPALHAPSRSVSMAVFPNLGGDARLVVPCPTPATSNPAPHEGGTHLASFLRTCLPTGAAASGHDLAAPCRRLWFDVGRVMEMEVMTRRGRQSTWLSTSGLGVAWLHVRIDSIPKYYQYQSYRRDPVA